jgi:divalent metal cation (Fe/Co/Zn/Cd) transporter
MSGPSASSESQPALAGRLSLAVNGALLALKLAMAAFSGSLALAAETTHNLLVSLSVLVGRLAAANLELLP